MILQYYHILKYHWLSKVKQQFMAYWQQQFYNPIFDFSETKHTAQWRNTTSEMTAKIMTEKRRKQQRQRCFRIRTRWSDLQYYHDALVSWRRIGQWRRWRCVHCILGMYVLEYNVHYIYPIDTIVKMCHKLLYSKNWHFGVVLLKHTKIPVENIRKYATYLRSTTEAL